MARKITRIAKLAVGRGELLDRFFILRKIARVLLPEYKFKWPQLDWWDDPVFNRYLYKFDGANSVNADRRWMVFQLLRLVKDVPGDTAECGAYKGASSYLIIKMNNEANTFKKHHYIFDSFEGLSEPMQKDGVFWRKHDLSSSEAVLASNLAGLKGYTVYKGWIPEKFCSVAEKKFSFVHVDVDLYQPTRESIEFFYQRLNESGIFLCDDYGFNSCPGATKAIDEFLSDKPEKMVMLSAGCGFFIKGKSVQDGKYLSGYD